MKDRISTLRLFATLTLAMAVLCMSLSFGLAQRGVQIVHRALRQRILRDAGDRYDVQFLTTSTSRLSGAWQDVTGRGRFRRRGKNMQRFTYHATVNVRNRQTRNVGYDIRR